jgi:hypothetical protein
MKNMPKLSLLAVSGLVMAMNTQTAFSDTSYAYAAIDWSTFNIEGYGIGGYDAPDYTLTANGSYTNSNTSDWVNWSSDVSNSTSWFAANVSGDGQGSGTGSVNRSANITISGDGFLIISADYELGAAINGISNCSYYYGCYYGTSNAANASVNFDLTSQYSSNGSQSSHSQYNISLGGYSYPYYNTSSLTEDEKYGVLAVGVIVHDGDILNFSAAVSASANDNGINDVYGSNGVPKPSAVPLPSAVWLFGSVLFGFLGLGRRKGTI